MKEQCCELCTGTHPSWMCVDHLERGELLDEIYKLRKTLLEIKPMATKKPDKKFKHTKLTKYEQVLHWIAQSDKKGSPYNLDRAACQKLAEEALK